MPATILLLVSLSAALLLLPFTATAQQNLSYGADLEGLFSLRGSLGIRAAEWPRKEDPCSSWSGVGCRDGRVVSINLHGLRRTRIGRLNPKFAVDGLQQLTRLEAFNASGFALPGSIPVWFGTLLPISITSIDLSGAAVNGSIPDSLGGAAGLRFLSLAGNSISSDIPLSLGQLSNLTYLDLSSNFLSGSVPPSFVNLSGLRTLAVAGNSLTGTIPPELGGRLSELEHLDLSSNALYGEIPPSIGTLSKLLTLNLKNNSLAGAIPPGFGDLSSLVSLDLGFNSLVGSLPNELQNLKSLQSLDLGSNLLIGSIPGALFAGVFELRDIELSNNNLTGALPESFWTLRSLRSADFSRNNLTGSLPDLPPANAALNPTGVDVGSGASFNLSHNSYFGSIPSAFPYLFARFSSVDLSGNYFQGAEPTSIGTMEASFDGNCFKNATNQRGFADCESFYAARGIPYDGPVAPPGPNSPPPGPSRKKKRGWSVKYILIGVCSGIVLLLIVIAVIVLCLMRCGGRAAENREDNRNVVASFSSPSPPAPGVSATLPAFGTSFTYDQLVEATSGFNEANLIKRGHSGDLYHGTLEGGVAVVVKKIDSRTLKKGSYVAELEVFAKASHTRLVPLLGHCLDNDAEKFLVYKFMPNMDLSNALHKKRGLEEGELRSLDWITRLKIATGVTEALCFLHHECNPPLVHRDIQASSILLEDKFEVCLGSLSEVCPQEDVQQRGLSRILRFSQPSESSTSGSPPATCAYDVFCLGKVLLELVTGKPAVGSGDSASEWFEHSLGFIDAYERELVTKIVDPSLVVDEDHLEEVWAVAIVAKSCLNQKPSRRPPTRFILKALESPLKVVREDTSSGSVSGSGQLRRTTSSKGLWNAATLFGSWRRDDRGGGLKRSGTSSRSQGSTGEHSNKRPSKEIFPAGPSGQPESADD